MMILRMVLLAGSLVALAACGPLIGGAAVVGADELVEEDQGGDGLF